MNTAQVFAQAIQQLNQAQWEAVRNIEGPVLTIAGPGTGKTHILTARIGQILLQTDTQPHNILCLTFTDAGVFAMRQRLQSFIGGAAQKVHIFTFHSFCNKIIQENLEVFGRYNLQPLSELERIEIIRKILLDLDYTHPLRASQRDVFHYEGHLATLFKQMKTEHWTAAHISEKIDEYLADIPERADFIYQRNQGGFKRGDLRTSKIAETIQKMERLRAAAALYESYAEALYRRQRYDYEDMILWVLEGFDAQPFLLRRYQEQYLYLLVDEFQDTNGAQNSLIHKLMAYWGENPNIFIVGDDDQAIYEFQGARVKNMLDFFERYQKNILLVQLQENYRSSQHILDASKYLIDHNKLRLVEKLKTLSQGKQLWASNPAVAQSALKISVIVYPNRLQEELGIIKKIQALQTQGIDLQEIAIIFARHRQARDLIRLLEKNNIPYKTKRRLNIFELPIIQNIRQLLRYTLGELLLPNSQEELFFELLHYPYFGILPQDLRGLSILMSNQSGNTRKGWLEIILSEPLLAEQNWANIKSLRAFGGFVKGLLTETYQMSLPELIEFVYNRSGLLAYALASPQKAWLLEVLNTFFGFVQAEWEKNPSLGLAGFLDIWQKMEDNRIGLGLFKTDYSESGVQLITAHSCKGLEFKQVFLLNCLKDFWEVSHENPRQHFAIPDTLTFSNESDGLEAARRLFYVAVTRAKEGLHISYYEKNEQDKPQTPALFVEEILAHPEIETSFYQAQSEGVSQAQALFLSNIYQIPSTDLLPKASISGILEEFRMSVSALTAYLYCPLSFYYEYVLRIPHTASNEAMYGIAAHEAIKRLYDTALKTEGKELPSESAFIGYFGDFLSRQPLNPQQRATHLQKHLPELRAYYQQRVSVWEQELKSGLIWTERGFKQLEIEGVPVTGIVDKLILQKNETGSFWKLVDYKTGKLQPERLSPPSPQQPNGGVYWRQLIFYKLLLEGSGLSPYKIKLAEIDYLSPNSEGIFEQKRLEVRPEDAQFVKKLIKDTYEKIQAQAFDDGCGRPSCKWCAFVQNQQTAPSFNHEEIESLDERSR